MAPIKVLIVGGGCAGWMAAVYLQAALDDNGQRRVDIGVIESPDAPQTARGEATLPDIRRLLDVVGLSEIDFLKRVDGTFKQAIKHVNWVHGHGEHYFHTLDRSRMEPIDTFGMLWLMSDHSIPFAETTSTQPIICELGLAPKPLGNQDNTRSLSYAYHLNARKFADVLREIAVSMGVSHHLDDVASVDMADSGDVAAILTHRGKRLDADLFVDCTGQDALLIGERRLGGLLKLAALRSCHHDRHSLRPLLSRQRTPVHHDHGIVVWLGLGHTAADPQIAGLRELRRIHR
jgi:tryptophan halogenase